MQVRISNVYSFGDSRQLTRNCAGHGPREKEITLLLNASRADRVKNITYVKYEVCQLVESASSLLALDIARESKVSALGLKFLGPAQRFTRSRGYRLSFQEVMPSSRREYQILHRYTLSPRSRPRILHVFKPVSQVAPQVYTYEPIFRR